MIRRVLILLTVSFALGAPTPAAAQGYRVRLEARAQSVAFRGLALDSIPIGQAAAGPTGGLISPDGFAVHCSTAQYCYYFRPGPDRRGLPMTVTGNVVLWGLGIEGLTLHAAGRVVADAGDEGAWPTTGPAVQLLEGYLEYGRRWFTGRAGRLLLGSRLEHIGFDGAWARARWDAARLEVLAYGGWGLGQAAVVPVTSPLLNPLDEWRPTSRQLVAGGEAGWHPGPVDVRAEYRREVDPELDYFVSERASASFSTRPVRALLATGGMDYNVAEDLLGSADLSVTWLGPHLTATAGARRYRPYFSLWTLWGAFSPVPYHAVHGAIQVRPDPRLRLRGRGEHYWYEPSGATTALVRVEDAGWRVSLGATGTPDPRWTVDAGYLLEFGPGSAARHFDAAVTWLPREGVQLSAYGGRLHRPLEFRYYDATTTWLGGQIEWRPAAHIRTWADAAWYRDERERPDPAATDWNQVRLRAGIAFSFGSSADGLGNLPPARRGSR